MTRKQAIELQQRYIDLFWMHQAVTTERDALVARLPSLDREARRARLGRLRRSPSPFTRR